MSLRRAKATGIASRTTTLLVDAPTLTIDV
jgi:hypothetical protein